MKNCNSKTVSSPCKSASTFASRYSSVLGFIILILPKCSLCLVAYSSAITLCGASSLITHTTHHTDWGAYVALGMSIIITGCILFSYKSTQYSSIALLNALCGMLLLSIGIFKTEAMTCYYGGATLLVVATFVYSGLIRSFLERFKNSFHRLSIK